MKVVVLRFGLVVGSLLIGLGVCELAFRILGIPPTLRPPVYRDRHGKPIVPGRDFELFGRRSRNAFIRYELLPNGLAYMHYARPWREFFDDQGRVELRINSLGLRDREFAVEPEPGTNRVLCLGDSFTFGNGVPLESSCPKQLERELRARHPGSALEVINAGFAAGSDIENHVAWLMAKGSAMKPRTVLLTVCLNDFSSVPMDRRQDVRISFPGRSRSRVLALVANALENLELDRAADPDACFRRHYPREDKPLWREALLVAREWCKNRGHRLLVVIYPMLWQLDDRYPWIRLHELMAGHCRENDIDCFDLLDAFRGRDARALWAHPTDQHPGPEGHGIAARALADALEARGWVP